MRSIFLFITFVVLIFFIFFNTVLANTDEFLKFHWKFDEGTGTTVGDSSGNTPSYPGTAFNGPSWISGGGLSFDGIDDYARTNSAIPNSMGVSDQAYTLSASVRIPEGEEYGNIIHISNNSNGIGWCIAMLHLYDGKFRAIGWDGGPVTAIAPDDAIPGQWYSIANTWSPDTKELRLYINGELVAATPMTTYVAANANVYVFAGINATGCSNNQGWFKGDVKDVRIYSREITQEEAEDNSNESIASPTPTAIPTATIIPTQIPTPTTSSNNNNNTSKNTNISCDSQTPSNAPDLFQISTSTNNATIYFTPVNPASGYIINYGTNIDADQYSAIFDYTNAGGAIPYTINSLNSNTKYYFKVQAKYNCATGSWSNTRSETTTSIINSNVTQQKNVIPVITEIPRGEIKVIEKEQIESPKKEAIDNTNQDNLTNREGYDVEIFVQKNGKPVAGASVELHSVPRKTITDNNGIARFGNVEKGNHTVYLAYEGYYGEEKIILDSENKKVEINLTIEVKPYSNWILYGGILLIGILIGIIIILVKRKKKN